MRISLVITFILLVVTYHVAHSSDDSAVQIGPNDNTVSHADLQILGSALGVFSESFDYESDVPHCVHFTVEVSELGEEANHIDAGGHCGLGGPHRITIQWRDKDDKVSLYFNHMHREENSYYGGFGGPTFDKPAGVIGTNGGPLTSVTEFALGRPLELTRREFFSSGIDETTQEYFHKVHVSVSISVELRSNPEKKIGSG